MSELPRGWAKISLKDIGNLHCGQSPAAADVNVDGLGTPYVTGPEQWDGRSLHRPKWTTDPRRIVPDGCIFITVKGAGVGKTFPGIACAIGRDVYAFEPATGVEFEFVLRAIQHRAQEIIADARGDIPGLSKGHIEEYQTGLPPLPEQRRIVAKLDRLSARSRAARDHLARTATLAARAKQAILAAAFQGKLTTRWRERNPAPETAADLVARTPEPKQSRGGREATTNVIEGVGGISVNDPGTPVPEGWAWVRLRRIARQETGHTPSRSHPEWWGGDVPWISIKDANAHHGRVVEETVQTINEDGLANSSARLLPAKTVCLSRTASVGYVTVMGQPMATSQDFATWTCSDTLDPFYLMYALMSEGDDIRRFGEGSTHTTIYFPEIRAFHVKLAPLEEQREIVRRIETAFARIDRLTAEAARAAHLLDRLDERLLAKAFRGELVPQDPADEPAEALLARIRAARAAAPKPKRGRRPKKATT